MKIKEKLIDKIVLTIFLSFLIISNIFLIFEFKCRYVNIQEVYKINSNVKAIVVYDKNEDKCIKIEDENTINKIYEKISKIKVRSKYQNMYIKIYDKRRNNKNIYFNIYEEDMKNSRYITIYNKLIIIDGKCYVCDMDISKYIKNISNM